ncbi:deoxyribose-phosphate aldolase [bacterium]|nr:deoxyribose-phosphate aldolase [bacterium]
MKYSYEEIAGMIDHSLLHPTMTDKELERECKVAVRYKVASVCIKPYAVKMAAKILKGTGVEVGAVVGFPQGGNITKVKVFETEQACKDGATEIDMVINIGKALSGDWDYVKKDVRAVVREAHKHGAIVKVIFENDFMPNDRIKRKLCEICESTKADYVKTSTGYGFVKGEDGRYGYEGATEGDLKLMRKSCGPKVEVKAAGGVRGLDALMHCRDLGVRRVGASATKALLDDYKTRARAEKQTSPGARRSTKKTKLGGGGY